MVCLSVSNINLDQVGIVLDLSHELGSVVECVDFDLNLLKLLEELLQMHFGELDALGFVDIRRGKLFEIALLHVLVVFAGLFVCLQVERKFAKRCTNVSSEYTLFTGRRMVKDSMA